MLCKQSLMREKALGHHDGSMDPPEVVVKKRGVLVKFHQASSLLESIHSQVHRVLHLLTGQRLEPSAQPQDS